jgi:hypothetical protein
MRYNTFKILRNDERRHGNKHMNPTNSLRNLCIIHLQYLESKGYTSWLIQYQSSHTNNSPLYKVLGDLTKANPKDERGREPTYDLCAMQLYEVSENLMGKNWGTTVFFSLMKKKSQSIIR